MDHLYDNKRTYYINSKSDLFKELTYGRKVHVEAHGMIFVNPPYYNIIPKDTILRTVAPLGLNLYTDSHIYGEEYANNIKTLREIDEKMHEIRAKINNNPYTKKLESLVPQIILMKQLDLEFTNTYNISFSSWFNSLTDNKLFIDLMENGDGNIDDEGFEEPSLIQYYSSTKKIIEWLENNSSKTKDKYYHKEYSLLVQKHIKEVEKKYKEIHKTVTPDIEYLFKWKPLIEYLEELQEKEVKLDNEEYIKLFDKRYNYYSDKFDPDDISLTKISFRGILQFEMNEELGFTFQEGSLFPEVYFSGKKDTKEEWEKYFTITTIKDGFLHYIHLTDFSYEEDDYTLSEILHLLKESDITLWSCLGFGGGFPSWYHDNKCLGDSTIMGRKRGSLSISHDYSGKTNIFYTKYVEELNKDNVANTQNIELISKETDYEIERTLSSINMFVFKRAFLNTFTSYIDLQKINDFYNKFKNDLDEIIYDIKLTDDNLPLSIPTSYIENIASVEYPSIINNLKKEDLYLDIIFLNFFNFLNDIDINFVPYYDGSIFNVFTNIIISNSFGMILDFDPDDIEYSITDHLTISNQYYYNKDTRIFIKEKMIDGDKYKKYSKFDDTSIFDYEQIILCVINVLNKSINHNNITINLKLAKEIAKTQDKRVLKFINHLSKHLQ